MNEIRKCSLAGVSFAFDREAYTRLNTYIESLRKAYSSDPGCNEIIADIEGRIAELLLSAQHSENQVIGTPIIENIILQLGSVEDLTEGNGEKETKEASIPRRLYRDMENAKFGGVCAGIAKYLRTDTSIVRILVFVPMILSIALPSWHGIDSVFGHIFGVIILGYIIMWFAVPEARTVRQKLEMNGEDITASKIASQERLTKEEQAKQSVAGAVSTLGRVLIILMKVFMGLLLFPLAVIFMALVAVIIACLSGSDLNFYLFGTPLTDINQLLGSPLPTVLGILIVLVPVCVLIYLFITLILSRRPKGWILSTTFILWLLLLAGLIFTGIKYANFSDVDEVERIMKKSTEQINSRVHGAVDSLNGEETEPMDSLEYQKLLYEQNAKSIDI